MMLIRQSLFTLLLLSLPLAHPTVDKRATQGSIQIYSDGDCTTEKGPPLSLPINDCHSIEVSAVAAVTFPSCAKGKTPILSISDLEGCQAPSTVESSTSSDNAGTCLYFATGTLIGSFAFVCQGESETTTTSPSSLPKTPIPNSPIPTETPAAAQQTSSSSQPSSSQNNPSSSHSLSVTDRITLGLGVGIGIPTLIVGILAWRSNWLPRFIQYVLLPRMHRVPGPGSDPRGAPPPYTPYEMTFRYGAR